MSIGLGLELCPYRARARAMSIGLGADYEWSVLELCLKGFRNVASYVLGISILETRNCCLFLK